MGRMKKGAGGGLTDGGVFVFEGGVVFEDAAVDFDGAVDPDFVVFSKEAVAAHEEALDEAVALHGKLHVAR